MNILENLNWRYATKKMNGTAVPKDKVDYILEATRLAPSSSGLQPYQIIAVSNKELLEKIKPIARNQGQITEASHLLVFAAWDNYTVDRIGEVFKRTATERNVPENTMDDYKNMLVGAYTNREAAINFQHAAKQSYIAFGVALLAAAEQKVDATPMEGFDNEALDTLLNLKEKGLKSTAIMTLGYRDEANDWLVNMKKVRTPKEKFVTELK
jgi:nitroreductase/dihydropteridine reductase